VQVSSIPFSGIWRRSSGKAFTPQFGTPTEGGVNAISQGKGKILEIAGSPDSTDRIARGSGKGILRIGDAMVSGHIRAFDRNNLQHSLAVLAAFSDLGTGALAAEL
jgi:hypothetical protein